MDFVASPTSEASDHANDDRLTHAATEPAPGLVPSHNISLNQNPESPENKPPLLKTISAPAYDSPLRHHRRKVSSQREVKESLNARSEYITSRDDGVAEHRINQYTIKQEIGRGSFGAVHLAVDQYGTEFAVKEFSKARLRKRAQSHLLRKPLSQRKPGALAARKGFNSPLHRNEGSQELRDNAIELIKEEIAIMKKLNHPNLCSLFEVLDDPSEDSLYMVMEMCKKGVVMRVNLEERADPYPDDQCRVWFRDLILGIEYLHAQGVVHRDIKPDNCLVTDDDVLKVVDFGVSEMFEKDTEMVTAKSAGSPAFLPPELCVARHGDISGKAADIWSMGITLYCLKYGRIPFEQESIFSLYEAIKDEQPDLSAETDRNFLDLISRVLEKDPKKRIKMSDLREHPWVTCNGNDPLLSAEENTSNLVEPPTEAEMNAAITSNVKNLMTVVKAVNKFKSLIAAKRPTVMHSILGDTDTTRFSEPPTAIQKTVLPLPGLDHRSHSVNHYDRGHPEGALVADGVHKDHIAPDLDSFHPAQTAANEKKPSPSGRPTAISSPPPPSSELLEETERQKSALAKNEGVPPVAEDTASSWTPVHHARTADDTGHRGHAHDPLQDHLYLFVGPTTLAGPSPDSGRRGSFMPDEEDVPIVSESPGAADIDIYETAYSDEIERIKARAREEQKEEPAVYLTRRVDAKLLAFSTRMGRLAAAGGESLNQFRDYTQFRERKAMVTDVSKALKEAAKEEYVRRKQEYDTARAEKAKARDSETEDSSTLIGGASEATSSTTTPEPGSTLRKAVTSPSQWSELSAGKGKQARTSFRGLMDIVKTKSKTMKGDK